jgi:hypothetical protein
MPRKEWRPKGRNLLEKWVIARRSGDQRTFRQWMQDIGGGWHGKGRRHPE